MASKTYRKALQGLLEEHAPAGVRTRAFGPKTAGLALAELRDVPSGGATTWVTMGVAEHQRSMWRGLPLGHELGLALAARDDDVVELLEAAVLEDRRRARDDDRRPLVEARGVWAPGHAPHLVFTDTPAIADLVDKRHKVHDRYVSFLAAVPIDDADLRLYDRDPKALIERLAPSGP